MGQYVSLPALISPTGVQAVHPDGEVAVARPAATRGTVMDADEPTEREIAGEVADEFGGASSAIDEWHLHAQRARTTS